MKLLGHAVLENAPTLFVRWQDVTLFTSKLPLCCQSEHTKVPTHAMSLDRGSSQADFDVLTVLYSII